MPDRARRPRPLPPRRLPAIPPWSAREHVQQLDRLGIATVLLSGSTPGVHLGDRTSATAGDPPGSRPGVLRANNERLLLRLAGH